MRLIRVAIKNFKLLEDVAFEFSTDRARPLTVIRAENGSGKTSLLYALLWGFYGMRGLPEAAGELRLTSSAVPSGKEVEIQVLIDFDHTDESGIESRYRLIRSVTEKASTDEKVHRDKERVRLMRVTAQGDEEQTADALVQKLIPYRLRDVFFTNGDAVQTFISGSVSQQTRQAKVKEAIRALLGLDELKMACTDLKNVVSGFRTDVSKAGGQNLSELEAQLKAAEAELASLEAEISSKEQEVANMQEQKSSWSNTLQGLRIHGDLEELNERIGQIERDLGVQHDGRQKLLLEMRELVKGEAFSWAFAREQLDAGLEKLDALADKKVIPGSSLQVLNDRLELGICICGESVPEGSPGRSAIERLRDEQYSVTEARQRLTQLRYSARESADRRQQLLEEHRDFWGRRAELLKDFATNRDLTLAKNAELKSLVERRSTIDDERVQDLVDKLRKVEVKIADAHRLLGEKKNKQSMLQEAFVGHRERHEKAVREAKVSSDVKLRLEVAEDLFRMAAGTLKSLEKDEVERVSERMNKMFMSIVGSSPEFGVAAVFREVAIGPEFDIHVETHSSKQLDTDFELNGASQRALTLAFIWALMDVSGVIAPRIIDTPLGMVAGGVKTRMVEALTRPSGSDRPDYQVVLLLTRSEVRDIESLIDERAGVVRTMSCSKDYPVDLVHDWNSERPLVLICMCNHRQSCQVCARRYDAQHGIVEQVQEA